MIPQNALCKENADNCILCAQEMFNALPKKMSLEYIGHLNDLLLFLGAAQRQLPPYEQIIKEDKVTQ